MLRSYGLAFLVVLAVVLSSCSLAGDITPPPGAELPAPEATSQAVITSPVYPLVAPNPANGKQLYEQECTACHGEKGFGDGPQAAQLAVPVAALGLSDFARQYTPAEWYNAISKGSANKFMPAFPTLTDRQRWDVVAYAFSLSTSAITVTQGETLYQGDCASCHGIAGKGDGPGAAALSIKPRDLSNQAFMAQNSTASLFRAITEGIAPDMPAFSSSMDDTQRWALAGYLRSLTFIVNPSSVSAITTPATSQLTAIANTGTATSPNPLPTQTPSSISTSSTTPAASFLGSVTVQLLNGSGGDVPSDAPVTLYGFDDMQNTYSETIKTGANGIYTFSNLLMPEGRVFMAGTDYASATYGSDIVTANPTTPDLSLQITVYDSTTDVSLLSTDRVHIFFDFTDPQNVQVIEVFIISNPSKAAVVPVTPDGTVVNFPLPQGYTNLQFQDGSLGSRYVESSQGFADRMTVNPGVGKYQVIFAFQMPYNRKLDFIQQMSLPTSAVVVMVPDNGVKMTSAMLQAGGTRDYQGTSYRMYNGSSLIAGSSLDFTLSGRPKQAGSSLFTAGTMQNLAIGLGGFGVALVGFGLWLFRRNQRRLAMQGPAANLPAATISPELGKSLENENTLVDAIIALDDQFHAGNLPQDAYLERRAVLKEKLRKMEQG